MSAQPLELMLAQELPSARRGSQEAYGRIVSACQNTVTAIALAITHDVQASEDIAQEAFLRAWQRLDRLKNSTSFLPWLRQITRNLARDYLRTQQHKPLSGEAAEIAIGIAADPSPAPEEQLLRTEEEIAAADIISALPEDSRETLLLYYREGQSSQQVADLLGLSDAAVRKRLSRARGLVREEMLRRFGEFAKRSAPGTAFTVLVAASLMSTAPVASAAIAVGATAATVGGGKLGASGLGAVSVSGGTAFGSFAGVFGVLQDSSAQVSFNAGFATGTVLGSIIGGAFGAYVGGRYLLGYAETENERAALRRFVLLNTSTAALVGIALNLAVLLTTGWWAVVAVATLGMGIVNYQCLVPLRRLMIPLLARRAVRRGQPATRIFWCYESLYGWLGVVWASVFVLVALLYALRMAGRF